MFQECRHIMPTGSKCHSPAMRGMAYCYFHRPGRRNVDGRSLPRNKTLELPVLDDRTAILSGIYQIIDAIASKKISLRSAGQLLRGLEIASSTLRRPGRPPKQELNHPPTHQPNNLST